MQKGNTPIQGKITADFVNAVTLFHEEKNRALGINWDTELIRQLKELRQQEAQKQVAKLQLAIYLQASIKAYQVRMKEILVAENRHELLEEAHNIQGKTALAVAMLKELENG